MRAETKTEKKARKPLIVAIVTLVALASFGPRFAGAKSRYRGDARLRSQSVTQENRPQPEQGYAISVSVPVVTLDVVVTDNEGNYLTGLKKEHFRVTEEGVRQTITNFATTDAPMTAVLLLEYSQLGSGAFLYNATSWADAFLSQLQPKDWVALSTFSMRPKVEVDFTHRWAEVRTALGAMVQPDFRESNLFDALIDTLERMKHVPGKKSILLLASGLDTFSSANFDEALASARESDVVIYCLGIGEQTFLSLEMRGGLTGTGRLAYLQAQSQLRTFSETTGGRAWFPGFQGEIPSIMSDIAGRLRNQYGLAYTPVNQKMDGKYHKIKVELVAPDGGPLSVIDQNKKQRKFLVYTRQGYQMPKPIEQPGS
jgi:VWFA-related protein